MSFLIAARSELEPKYRFERCQEVKGICKTFCDDVEYDYGTALNGEFSAAYTRWKPEVQLNIKVFKRDTSY